MSFKKSFKIGDIVYCRCPDGVDDLPAGLPRNARAKVVATYIGTTYVCFEGKNFVVPNACVHSGSDDSGTLSPQPPPPEPPQPGAAV